MRSPRLRAIMPGSTAVVDPIGADQVNLDLGLEVVGADRIELAEVRVAGACDEHFDVAEFLGHSLDATVDRIRVGDVEVYGDGLATVGLDLIDDLLALLHAAGAERNRKAMGGKLDRRRGADT